MRRHRASARFARALLQTRRLRSESGRPARCRMSCQTATCSSAAGRGSKSDTARCVRRRAPCYPEECVPVSAAQWQRRRPVETSVRASVPNRRHGPGSRAGDHNPKGNHLAQRSARRRQGRKSGLHQEDPRPLALDRDVALAGACPSLAETCSLAPGRELRMPAQLPWERTAAGVRCPRAGVVARDPRHHGPGWARLRRSRRRRPAQCDVCAQRGFRGGRHCRWLSALRRSGPPPSGSSTPKCIRARRAPGRVAAV